MPVLRFAMGLILLAAGCSAVHKPASPAFLELRQEVVIDPSAAGWSVKLGAEGQTVLRNPRGQEFDVGKTQYPDIAPTYLLKLSIPELKASFLVLHIDPVASGGSELTVFTLLPNDVPIRAADLHHHWEWEVITDWKQTLFADSDGDGVLELRDWGAYRWFGTDTYYSFDGKRFHPLWVEEYQAPDDDDYNLKLVSRRKAQ